MVALVHDSHCLRPGEHIEVKRALVGHSRMTVQLLQSGVTITGQASPRLQHTSTYRLLR